MIRDCKHSAVAAQLTINYNGFFWDGRPSKVPLLMGDLDLYLYGSLGSWAHPSLHPKWHIDRFSRFHTADERNQRTQRHTHRHTNRPPLLRV